MPTITTSQWVSYAPQIRLDIEQAGSTTTVVTYSLKLYYVTSSPAYTNGVGRAWSISFNGVKKSGTFDINNLTGTHRIWSGEIDVNKGTSAAQKSVTISMNFDVTWSGVYGGTKTASGTVNIPALTSYKVTYNMNGGSGSISAQTKWAGKTLKLSTSRPTRSGYEFQGWATSSSGSVVYDPGDNYTANASVTLYAVWAKDQWKVTYDANGGTGAPASQTKVYGTTLKLSSVIPTRANYIFKGWATSSAATSPTYAPGADYTANASVTLYAVWEIGYKQPRIEGMTVERCNSGGTITDSGTYAKVSFTWSCDEYVSSIKIEWKLSSNSYFSYSTSVSASGTSGNVSTVIGSGGLYVDSSYDIRVTVTDANGSSDLTRNLGTIRYIIDILNGGNGIAFGKAASIQDTMDVYFKALFEKEAEFDGVSNFNNTANFNSGVYDRFQLPIGNGLCAYTSSGINPNTTLEHAIVTDYNTPAGGFMYILTYFYSTKSTSSNRMQVAYPYSSNGSQYHRYYYNGSWSSWRRHSNADEFDDYLVRVNFDMDSISISSGGRYEGTIPVSKSGYKIIGVTGINISNATGGTGYAKARLTQCYANTGSNSIAVRINNDATSEITIRIRGNALFFRMPT